jgi:RIO kinase 1
VYLCRSDETVTAKFLAAKIYRPRKFRNLKNDHLYREGRGELGADGLALLDGGMQHAMRKRTAYGLELLHASWIAHEVKTLNLLHAAGADVPEVYASGDNAILMEYIGDEDLAAPTLNTLKLGMREASVLFERALLDIEIMLANQRVHGDLSAFNIFYWRRNITLIDFPQAISPHENRNAYWIFQRDVRRICEYFIAQGVRCDAAKIARDMWTAHHLKISPSLIRVGLTMRMSQTWLTGRKLIASLDLVA